jgi:nucleoside-diphosphate-sugar epimerase
MRILVTGADGFLGSHVANGLERAGHDIVRAVFSRPPRRGELHVDLTRTAELRKLPRVDALVHAAGTVDAHQPRAVIFALNLGATENLIAWARQTDVAHVIQLSSVAVYGPLVLGEQRTEQTPRLGLGLGLPYMRSKALAERAIEQSGLPYTLVRPPVVLGRGDTVISRGFFEALRSGGLPMLPGASAQRRVSVLYAEGLAEIVRLVVAHGPLWGALHAVDAELSLGQLAHAYARALGCAYSSVSISWQQALRVRNEAGLSWLIASARFGQHYQRERLLTELGYRSALSLESAVEDGLSGLQGGSDRLF